MNIFTNKNGDILPFQMVKLASGLNAVKGAVDDAWDTAGKWFKMVDGPPGTNYSVSGSGLDPFTLRPGVQVNNNVNVTAGASKGRDVAWDTKKKYLTEISEGVEGVGKQVGDLSNQVNDSFANLQRLISNGATKEQITNAVKLLAHQMKGLQIQLERAIAEGNTALANRITQQIQGISNQNAALAQKIPGWGKMMTAAGVGSAVTTTGAMGAYHLANSYANKAHAAGTDAAKEGELAAQQKGQGNGWWDNTWNDINKFREENPGLFYGGLGVGLLGGGYALSEMLDDDDDEEDEYYR